MSFEELVNRVSPTLKRITYKLNGHFSFFNDEDLFQEALMHLWVCFQEGKLSDKTDSYILQGCYFHLKNYLRKAQDKAHFVSIDAFFDEEGVRLEETLSLEPAASCFEEMESELLSERIRVLDLTKREREILSFCLGGLTVREIGKRMGISHVRVVKLKHKMQEKCKRLKDEIRRGYQE